ncbi:hypothetical protein LCGC14_2197780 [marine sediment metagenome]|uniref:Uncharacterized protein n=1 Tax=marine sediment metagenome TaxID=412755 RepID=A0A0F9DHK9_9ZZZZ
MKVIQDTFAEEARGMLRSVIRAFLVTIAVAIASALGIEGYLNLTPTGQDIQQTIEVVNEISVTFDSGELPDLVDRMQRWLDSEGISR